MKDRVIGVDVGGPRKGFHAVALEGSRLVARHRTSDANALASWCLAQNACVVAVDAPCRWRGPGLARAAERELAAAGISCYFSPTEHKAQEHPFYAWMIPGAALYAALQSRFPLYLGDSVQGAVCIETFPQAVACALAGGIVSAKEKNTIRRSLLKRAGIDTDEFTSIDEVDAALCALTAARFAEGDFKAYGDPADGFIIVPRMPLIGAPDSPAFNKIVNLLPALSLQDKIRLARLLESR